jgi:hypothetical protein
MRCPGPQQKNKWPAFVQRAKWVCRQARAACMVTDACLKCFIYLLLYVASVATRCFKSRSGYCICCNSVSTVCSKCYICFRRMLQRFHLDITKVDQGVTQRSRWLSLLRRSRGSIHVGFPMRGAGPFDGRGRGFWGGTRRVGQGYGYESGTGVGATSRRDIPFGR